VATAAGQLPSAHARDRSGASRWGGWAASQPTYGPRGGGGRGVRLGRAMMPSWAASRPAGLGEGEVRGGPREKGGAPDGP
jgi:hypothetical protein